MSRSLSKSIKTTGRSALVAGLLAMSVLSVAPSANAASIGHQPGMTTGPVGGPSMRMPSGRLHGHEGPTQAPPYAYDQSGHVRHVHQYDPNWRPDVPVSATTGLKPR